MMRFITGIAVCALLYACQEAATLTEQDQQQIATEVRQMLARYNDDVRKNGLPAEFKYLDNSPGFFWVPPGFLTPLSYDSVADIIKGNAGLFASIDNHWDTLLVYPLTHELASYSGRLSSITKYVTGEEVHTTLMETGTAIKRKDGWKMLSGHTTVVQDSGVYN